MPILDHFGILAPFYDRVIGERAPDKMIELLSLPISGLMLDAAGGTGRVSSALAGLTGGVIIADESRGMLISAGEKSCCQLACTRTEQLPFADNVFERVLMVDALHHVVDQTTTVRQMWRVLSPGGRIVIEEFNLHRLGVKLVALAEKLVLMRSHFLYPEQIASMLVQAGAQPNILLDGWTVYVSADKPNMDAASAG